jgi:parallel beta-helix repeat protein
MKIILTLVLFLLCSSCNADRVLDFSAATRAPLQLKNPSNCPKWKAGDSIKITKNTQLPKGCAYNRVTFIISRSNVTFDCNHATLNGLGKVAQNGLYRRYKKSEAPRNTAFSIIGSEDSFLQNITIKNCNLRFYINGFNVGFTLKPATRHALKQGKNIEALENKLRTRSPKNIRIENNKIIDSHKSGIFLQRYITHVTANNNVIHGAGDIGIYLESGSQKNTISNSTFSRNGGTFYNIRKRMRKLRFRKREAIAMDSSAYNIIKNNTFINNAGGAIFMYKNCYERHQEARQLPRYQGSNFNLIKNNTFSNERKGIWIASRQSRNLANFNCGDNLLTTQNAKKYYEDFSKNNTIINNTFKNTDIPIIIEDDHTRIINNIFKHTKFNDIIIGASNKVGRLHTIKGTLIKNNRFSFKSSVLQRNHPTGTRFSGNQPPMTATH